MPAKILHQVKINGNPYWSLSGRYFKTDGVEFEITGSAIMGDGPYNVVHTVKNITKGTSADIHMSKLLPILMQSE